MSNLGERMKQYERLVEQYAMPLLPLMVRLDGRCFHSFCQDLERPYDHRLSRLMVRLTVRLIEETHALMGYTQSDEITLVLYSDDPKSQLYFDGRLSKINSVLAGLASAYFNAQLPEHLPEKIDRENPAVFDCRSWNVSTLTEAANVFLWRELDATRNSLSMAAGAFYPHQALHGKNWGELHEMLFRKGVNWHYYPAFFKRGTFVRRQRLVRVFTPEEIERLPPHHQARTNPNLRIERTEIALLEMPPFSKVQNREGVIFYGEEPILYQK